MSELDPNPETEVTQKAPRSGLFYFGQGTPSLPPEEELFAVASPNNRVARVSKIGQNIRRAIPRATKTLRFSEVAYRQLQLPQSDTTGHSILSSETQLEERRSVEKENEQLVQIEALKNENHSLHDSLDSLNREAAITLKQLRQSESEIEKLPAPEELAADAFVQLEMTSILEQQRQEIQTLHDAMDSLNQEAAVTFKQLAELENENPSIDHTQNTEDHDTPGAHTQLRHIHEEKNTLDQVLDSTLKEHKLTLQRLKETEDECHRKETALAKLEQETELKTSETGTGTGTQSSAEPKIKYKDAITSLEKEAEVTLARLAEVEAELTQKDIEFSNVREATIMAEPVETEPSDNNTEALDHSKHEIEVLSSTVKTLKKEAEVTHIRLAEVESETARKDLELSMLKKAASRAEAELAEKDRELTVSKEAATYAESETAYVTSREIKQAKQETEVLDNTITSMKKETEVILNRLAKAERNQKNVEPPMTKEVAAPSEPEPSDSQTENLNDPIAVLNEEAEITQAQLTELENKLVQKDLDLSTLQEAAGHSEAELAKKDLELTTLQKTAALAETKAEAATVTSTELNQRKQENEVLEGTISYLKKEAVAILERLAEVEAELAKKDAELAMPNDVLEKTQDVDNSETKILNDTISSLKQEADVTHTRLAEVEAELAKKELELTTLKEAFEHLGNAAEKSIEKDGNSQEESQQEIVTLLKRLDEAETLRDQANEKYKASHNECSTGKKLLEFRKEQFGLNRAYIIKLESTIRTLKKSLPKAPSQPKNPDM